MSAPRLGPSVWQMLGADAVRAGNATHTPAPPLWPDLAAVKVEAVRFDREGIYPTPTQWDRAIKKLTKAE